MDLAQFLTSNPDRLKVGNPINTDVFKSIPFFGEVFEESLWPLLAKLSDDSGKAQIEHKIFKPGEMIIKKGQYDMVIFWLLKGRADIIIKRRGHDLLLAKKYDKVGGCFGENAIIDPKERTAFVYSGKGEGCEVLEIDWSITEICFELKSKFNELLLKTINSKLMEAYGHMNKLHETVEMLKSYGNKR